MKRVILEAPFAGDVDSNVAYTRRCLRDSLDRGEAPFSSALLYPGALDDLVPEQRRLGMDAGHAWRAVAEMCVVYIDRGISPGMQEGINASLALNQRVITRRIEKPFSDEWDRMMKDPGGLK